MDMNHEVECRVGDEARKVDGAWGIKPEKLMGSGV